MELQNLIYELGLAVATLQTKAEFILFFFFFFFFLLCSKFKRAKKTFSLT